MSEIDWSKAPEGATHYCDQRNARFKWFKMDDGILYRHHPDDGWEPSLRNSQPNPACDLIPRPTQWRGPEDGLPPVGTVALGRMPTWRKEERCKVIAHLHGSCVVVHGIGANPDSWSTLSWCDQFRPLKSDKERAVEAAMKVMPYPGSPSTRTDLECAYDAGLLRLPEEQS